MGTTGLQDLETVFADELADVLEPLGPGGSRRYRATAHDLCTDAVLEPEPQSAPAGAVLVVDGLFLLRPELAPAWDLSVFIDAPFEVTAARLAARDGTDPTALRRYVEAHRIYDAACTPRDRADVLIDNGDHDAPSWVWRPSCSGCAGPNSAGRGTSSRCARPHRPSTCTPACSR